MQSDRISASGADTAYFILFELSLHRLPRFARLCHESLNCDSALGSHIRFKIQLKQASTIKRASCRFASLDLRDDRKSLVVLRRYSEPPVVLGAAIKAERSRAQDRRLYIANVKNGRCTHRHADSTSKDMLKIGFIAAETPWSI